MIIVFIRPSTSAKFLLEKLTPRMRNRASSCPLLCTKTPSLKKGLERRKPQPSRNPSTGPATTTRCQITGDALILNGGSPGEGEGSSGCQKRQVSSRSDLFLMRHGCIISNCAPQGVRHVQAAQFFFFYNHHHLRGRERTVTM